MKKTFLLLLVTLVTISCSSDDSSNSSNNTNNTISLKLNGVDQVATIESASLIKYQSSNEQLLQIFAENNDYVFQLNFFGDYSSNNTLPTGDYVYTDILPEGYFYVSYKLNGNTYGMHSPDSGTLNISSMNGSTNTVSGTFNQILTGGGELNGQTLPTTLNITNGVFNNIEFDVYEY